MYLGIPGETVKVDCDHPDLAIAAVSGVRRQINVGLLEGEALAPGDWVLIHVGFALSKIDQKEAVPPHWRLSKASARPTTTRWTRSCVRAGNERNHAFR